MKLRNKKTGKIGNFCYGYTNELCVSWQKDDGFWGKQEYNSLAELNEEWQDYQEPKEYWYYDTTKNGIDKITHLEDKEKDQEIGNYFETREEAEKAVEKLKAWKRLKDRGFRFKTWGWEKHSGKEFTIWFTIEDFESSTKDLDLLFGGEE